MSDDMDRVAAAIKRLVIVCNNNKPVLRVKLHFLRQVLSISRLRCHRSEPVTGATSLILNLIVLNVVTVGLLRRQQLNTHTHTD